MSQLTLRINGYAYTVGCEDGQEAHLQAMAAQVDSRVDSIKALGTTQSGEAKLLVLAALLLADELHDLGADLAEAQKLQPTRAAQTSRKMASTMAQLADRAERIATELERP